MQKVDLETMSTLEEASSESNYDEFVATNQSIIATRSGDYNVVVFNFLTNKLYRSETERI